MLLLGVQPPHVHVTAPPDQVAFSPNFEAMFLIQISEL